MSESKKDRVDVRVDMPDGDTALSDYSLSSDDEVLGALGYKAEFKREFGLWSSFSVSFAVLGLLPSFASTLDFGMGYAGTGGKIPHVSVLVQAQKSHLCTGMVWGWIIAMVFIQCVAMSMAELCSSMPTRCALPMTSYQERANSLTVEDCIMPLLSSLPKAGARLLRGSRAGQTGSRKLRVLHQSTTACPP